MCSFTPYVWLVTFQLNFSHNVQVASKTLFYKFGPMLYGSVILVYVFYILCLLYGYFLSLLITLLP